MKSIRCSLRVGHIVGTDYRYVEGKGKREGEEIE